MSVAANDRLPVRPRTGRLRLLRLMPLLLIAWVAGLQAAPATDADIEFQDGQLRLSAEGADLRPLLQQLAEQAGFRLSLSAALPAQPVHIDIDRAPLEDALRRLLTDNSFALVQDAGGRVSALYVLPRGESQPVNATLNRQSEGFREQMLQNALASEQLPDNIKAAMLNQFNVDRQELRQTAIAQRHVAYQKLLEKIQQVGSASPETMQRLQEALARQRAMANSDPSLNTTNQQ